MPPLNFLFSGRSTTAPRSSSAQGRRSRSCNNTWAQSCQKYPRGMEAWREDIQCEQRPVSKTIEYRTLKTFILNEAEHRTMNSVPSYLIPTLFHARFFLVWKPGSNWHLLPMKTATKAVMLQKNNTGIFAEYIEENELIIGRLHSSFLRTWLPTTGRCFIFIWSQRKQYRNRWNGHRTTTCPNI